ncbi:SIR2 family NAD-dependent protein deacylase [Candidatus Methanomassiliicoccus intestinalis]|uniref:SIR2 family NAD-dependent protein deacylase n=1 Tax=Candidatus Methanomassiliicoccus intestinalis TaxID=1406512 RepID=UPI0037DDB33F
MTFTDDYSKQIKHLRCEIEETDAIVIGGGSGLSTSAGLTYSGKRFEENFSDFITRYDLTNMYTGGFYPYQTAEEYWAYWSRYIYVNRYDKPAGQPYLDLLKIVKNKDYFVITTNVDHQFQIAGFDKNRIFCTQGDYGLWQCSKPCHQKTYDNEMIVRRMVSEQEDMKIPSELIPHCPICGRKMCVNLRIDNNFVEDEDWHFAAENYSRYIQNHKNSRILFLELGVGCNTPTIIKYPFWRMTYLNPQAVYACINLGEAHTAKEIEPRSICIDEDIGKVLREIVA